MSASAKIVNNGDELGIFPQNVREFWNVATRPASVNGLGFSTSQVDAEISRVETAFTILQDGLPVYREWRRLSITSSGIGCAAVFTTVTSPLECESGKSTVYLPLTRPTFRDTG